MKRKHTLLFNRKVLGRGMVQRFFRRLAGVFDMEDLKFHTNELADFVEKTSAA